MKNLIAAIAITASTLTATAGASETSSFEQAEQVYQLQVCIEDAYLSNNWKEDTAQRAAQRLMEVNHFIKDESILRINSEMMLSYFIRKGFITADAASQVHTDVMACLAD